MCACTSFILLCNIDHSQETAQPRTIPCWQAVSGVISGITTRLCIAWVCHLLSTSSLGRFSLALEVGRSVYSESSICRQYAVWSKSKMFCKAMRSTFTVFVSAIEASVKGYATRKLRCGWAAIKGVGRPTRFLPHAKMQLVPIRFFPFLGRLCSGRFYIFTEQMWF